jgi:hypothetical protein
VNYDPNDPFCKWVNLNGVAFEFARTDWQYVTNTFCFGYGVGYKFSESKAGGCNGNFLGIGADSCQNAVVVEQAQAPGLLITNGEFVGRWSSADAVPMVIGPKVAGKVSLTNCSFWGPIDRCVWMHGPNAQFTAIGCNFLQYDINGSGSPAVQIDAGNAILQGNTFGDGQLQVRVNKGVLSAILIGNQVKGGFAVDNHAGRATQLVANSQDLVVFTKEARASYRINIGSDGDERYVKHWSGRESAQDEWNSAGTKRWSSPSAQLVLPVLPGKPYTVTVDVSIPSFALEPGAGIYAGNKQVIKFTKSETGVLSGTLPPSNSDTVTLDIRCKNWIPAESIKGNNDTRHLGIAMRSITLKAKGAGNSQFDGNTGVQH